MSTGKIKPNPEKTADHLIRRAVGRLQLCLRKLSRRHDQSLVNLSVLDKLLNEEEDFGKKLSRD